MHSPELPVNSAEVTTAICRIPPEILSNIFEIGYISTPESLKLSFTTSITSVCRRWRDASLNTAAVWSYFCINHFCEADELGLWLKRSHNYPLELKIVVSSECCDNFSPRYVNGPEWTEIYDVLGPRITQCHTLTISAQEGGSALVKLLEFIGSVPIPILQRLVVIGNDREDRNQTFYTNADTLQFRCGGPCLTELWLQYSVTLVCRPPLRNVTALHLALGGSSIEYTEFRQMLLSCLLLDTLAIYDSDCFEWSWRDHNVTECIDVPNLRTLQLYGSASRSSEPAKILWWLKSPKLTELALAPVTRYNLYFLCDIQPEEVKERFRERVKLLTLVPAKHHADVVSLAAKFFPGVESLTVPHIDDMESFVTEMNSNNTWPCLKDIILNDIDENNGHNLISLVDVRKTSGKPLERIMMDPSSLEKLRSLLDLVEEVGVGVLEISRWDAYWPDGRTIREIYDWN